MAVTRIKNNQITDATITGSKVVSKTITGGLLSDNLTYGSNLIISGNLTINGTTTTVDATNTVLADPLLVLSRGETGTPSKDSGIIIERGTSSNVGIIWDESADVFAAINTADDGTTSGDVTISSYANFRAADLDGTSLSIDNIDIDGNTISSTNANGNITITPNGSGDVLLSADTVVVGDSNTNATITTSGTGDLILNTNSGTNSGSITIADGVNGNISIAPNGTGQVIASNLAISNLTNGRVVLAGASGALADSANLTFNGTTLTTTDLTVDNIDIDGNSITSVNVNGNINITPNGTGEVIVATLAITDLTSGRVPYVTTNDAIIDSANLTFSGTLLTTTNLTVDNINVDANTITTTSGNLSLSSAGGEVTASSLAVTDLTSGRVTYASTSGALVDSANLTFSGTLLTTTNLTVDNVNVDGNTIISTNTNGNINITPNGTGELVASTLAVSDLTSGRVTYAGTSGALIDNANLTFSGTTLTVTGVANVSSNLNVSGEATLASATVSDLTSGRVTYAGASGSLIDSANLTFSGTLLTTTNLTVDNVNIDGNTVISTNTNGNINITPNGTGEVIASTIAVTDLTSTRVTYAGASGALIDSANLTFSGTLLTTTNLTVDNINVDANTITTTSGNLSLSSAGGEVTASSLAVTDLTSGRVTYASTSGALIDSANLTFSGTLLTTTNLTVDNINVDGNTVISTNTNGNINITPNGTGEVVASTLTVSDLTSGRVTYAGTSGSLIDNANLTFNGTLLTTTNLTVDNINVDANTITTTSGNLSISSAGGEVTASSLAVTDLTNGRVTYASTSGALIDSANLTFSGTLLTTTNLTVDNINVDGNTVISTNANGNINITPNGTGEVIVSTLAITDLTSGRVPYVTTNDAIIDSANLTFNGTTLGVTGNLTVDNITIDGDTISSVHSTITIDPSAAGAGGTVVIQGNLEVKGTTTTIDSTVVTIVDPVFQLGANAADDNLDRGIKALYNDGTAKSAFFGRDDSSSEFIYINDATDTSSVFSGTLGSAAFGSLRVTDLTNGRVLLAGASGEIGDSANLTFSGTLLTTTNLTVDNINVDANTITTTSGNLSLTSAGGEVTATSLAVSDLTSGRVTYASTSGALIDNANLTFSGTLLTTTNLTVDNINVDANTITTTSGNLSLSSAGGEVTASSLAVTDLTSTRVTYASTSGALIDSANLTFSGTLLTTTNLTVDNINVDANTITTTSGNLSISSAGGEVTASSLAVSDLTSGRVTYASTSGALIDSANLTFSGTLLTTTNLTVDNVNVDGNTIISTNANGNINITPNGTGEVVASTLAVTDLTSGRVTYAGTSGALIDNANLTFSGTTLTVTGVANVSSNLNVTGEATLASATVSDLTSGRVTYAGASGSLIDSANLTFSGTLLTTTNLTVDNINVDGNTVISTNTNGNINITPNGTGEVIVSTLAITDLTSGRVPYVTTNDAITDSVNFTFDGTTLNVTGNLTVDNVRLDGNTINTLAGNLSLSSTGGEVTASSLAVTDLTSGRVTYASTSGALVDSANLTFNGTDLTMTSAIVSDLTNTRVTYAGASGALVDSANLTFSGTLLTTTNLTVDNVNVDGNSIISTNTNGNINITPNGTGEVVASTLAVSDLTSGRVTYASTSGALIDSANLTFSGTLLTTTNLTVDNINVDGNTVISTNTNGNINITPNGTGEVIVSTLAITDLTSGRVPYVTTNDAIIDSANLTFSGTLLTTTNLTVDNVNVDGNSITSSNILTLEAAASQSIVINELGNDVDIRFESDTQVNAFFVEGSTGNIGIRTATPNVGAALHINTTNSMIVPTGATGYRPTGVAGMVRFNTTTSNFEFFDGVEWVGTGSDFTIITVDDFAGDGSTLVFTLSKNATSAGVIIAINGVVQDPGTAYGISGSTLTFTEAPAAGDNIDVRILITTSTVAEIADLNTGFIVNDATETATTTINGNVVMQVTNAAVVPGANVTYNLGSSSLRWNTIFGQATSAQYADLAENYVADQEIEPATVVCFGGEFEVTVCNNDADRRVAGVVSTNPAHLMNSDCVGEHVVAVALQGRVPCRVVGSVHKGDMMVSAGNGAARAEAEPKIGSVIGKALENFDGESGIIEVLVGRV